MTLTHAMPVDGLPVCADPKWLPLVDRAFRRPGGPAAHDLANHACPRCPVKAECLLLAMTAGEWGMWGAVGMKERTRRGAPPARSHPSEGGPRKSAA